MVVMKIIRTFVMVMMMIVERRMRITWRFQMEWVLVRTYRRPCCPERASKWEATFWWNSWWERKIKGTNQFFIIFFLQFLFLNINALNAKSEISYPLPDIRALISAPVNHIIKRVDIWKIRLFCHTFDQFLKLLDLPPTPSQSKYRPAHSCPEGISLQASHLWFKKIICQISLRSPKFLLKRLFTISMKGTLSVTMRQKQEYQDPNHPVSLSHFRITASVTNNSQFPQHSTTHTTHSTNWNIENKQTNKQIMHHSDIMQPILISSLIRFQVLLTCNLL